METRNHDNIERAPATRISAPRDGPHPGHPPLPDTSIVHVKEPEPRERGMPPVIPSPNRRLKISTGPNMAREKKQSVTRGPSGPRRQSRIVMLTNGHAEPRKPMPKWKRGYVGFKREVNSSVFVPLLLLLGLCGLATHVTGLAGMSVGYFRWIVECEGVVSVVEEDRESGVQTYNIGWARYEGTGPSQSSELGTAYVANPTAGSGLYAASQFGRGGIAGSSILEVDWLGAVDRASAAFGALTAAGHFAGVVFNVISVLSLLRLLLRTQFRESRAVFVLTSKASAVLLLWLLSFGGVGFILMVQEKFTAQIISTLHEEGFLCADNGKLSGEYAYIATGFGCVAYALMLLLTLWYGQAADKALADRFYRKASLVSLETESKTKLPSGDLPELLSNL